MSANPTCTTAMHEAVKLDAAAWSALPYRYTDRFLGDDEDPACDTEVRECTRCGSYLGLELRPVLASAGGGPL
jgi:hypothetical protein